MGVDFLDRTNHYLKIMFSKFPGVTPRPPLSEGIFTKEIFNLLTTITKISEASSTSAFRRYHKVLKHKIRKLEYRIL